MLYFELDICKFVYIFHGFGGFAFFFFKVFFFLSSTAVYVGQFRREVMVFVEHPCMATKAFLLCIQMTG